VPLIHEGRWQEARQLLESTVRLARSMRAVPGERQALARLAELDLLEGRPRAALAHLEPLAKAEMLRVAALGHRTLALGQGAELCWARSPQPLSATQIVLKARPALLSETLSNAKLMAEALDGVWTHLDRCVQNARRMVEQA